MSSVCDNCPLNQEAYKLLGGPAKVTLQPDGLEVFLVYDFVHIFKNIRNNWITESSKELQFTIDGKEYLACWNNIAKLYNADKRDFIRLTKLTFTSVCPKSLHLHLITVLISCIRIGVK